MGDDATKEPALGDAPLPRCADVTAEHAPTLDHWARYVEQSASMPPDAVVRELFQAACDRGRIETCLDLGCGGGRHLELLASRGARVIGVDGSPTSARKTGHAVTVQDLTAPLPIAAASVDFVLMWGVFVHLPPASHSDVVSEVRRVLRTGGTWVVDILLPADFRNKLGHEIAPNYNRSPFIEGVTDFFCRARYFEAIASPFRLIHERDLSHVRRDGRVCQTLFWLEKGAR